MQSIKLTTIDNKEIPLLKVDCRMDIVNQVCQYTIKQTYKNNEKVPIEASYVFPAPVPASS